jgi:hypothetical protein
VKKRRSHRSDRMLSVRVSEGATVSLKYSGFSRSRCGARDAVWFCTPGD